MQVMNILLLHSERAQSLARYIPDFVTAIVSALCGVAVRGREPEEEEEDEETVEMTVWDRVTNYFYANYEDT